MRENTPLSPAVVVGIDGSRGAIGAALWAVDEALARDLPLRLVYAIEPRHGARQDPQTVSRDFAAAECAVRHAAMAVESADRPVRIEAEILQGRAIDALLDASHSAPIVCVGALGANHAMEKRLGSTAIELLRRAHCPVAIIAGDAPRRGDTRWVITEFRDSPDAFTLLRRALDEAALRDAPLRVITAWRHTYADAERHLERFLVRSRRLYPKLDIKAIAVQGNTIDYLARHAEAIQLIVAGPGAQITPANLACSLLISEQHSAL